MKDQLLTFSVPLMMPGTTSEPVPYVMTESELIRFLRLDETGVADPSRTIRHYREKGILRATQIGRQLRYSLPNVLEFLELQDKHNPR